MDIPGSGPAPTPRHRFPSTQEKQSDQSQWNGRNLDEAGNHPVSGGGPNAGAPQQLALAKEAINLLTFLTIHSVPPDPPPAAAIPIGHRAAFLAGAAATGALTGAMLTFAVALATGPEIEGPLMATAVPLGALVSMVIVELMLRGHFCC